MVICKKTIGRWNVPTLLGAALLFGIAAMVRPVGQVLIVLAPMPVLLFSRISIQRRIFLSLLALSLPIALILAWSYRNYQRRGVWTFSSIAAVNLYYYRAAGVLAYETGESLEKVQTQLLHSTGGWDADPIQLKRRGAEILIGHPWAAALITIQGLARICFSPDRIDLSNFIGYVPSHPGGDVSIKQKVLSILSRPLLLILILFQFGSIIFTWVGVVLALWNVRGTGFLETAHILIPLSAALLLLLAAAGPEAYSRLRAPAMPMMALVAAMGWTGG